MKYLKQESVSLSRTSMWFHVPRFKLGGCGYE